MSVSFRQPFLVCMLATLPFLAIVLISLVWRPLDRPPEGDEKHYYPHTIPFTERGLAGFPDLDLLRGYHELSTPLTFQVYGLIGHYATPSLTLFRAVNLAFSVGNVALLSFLIFKVLHEQRSAVAWTVALTSIMSLSPYYLMVSTRYYTDILPLHCAFWSVYFAIGRANVLCAVFASLAVLGRQFWAFLPVLFFCRAMIRRNSLAEFLPVALPFIAILPLLVLWGGSSPASGRDVPAFVPHLSYANYMVINCGFYALPVAGIYLFMRRQEDDRRRNRVSLLLSVCLMPILLTAVPEPNTYMMRYGIETLGLVDRAVQFVAGDGVGRTALFAPMWFAGMFIILNMTVVRYEKPYEFLTFAAPCFLLMTSLAHLVWDKYFLSMLPFTLLCCACFLGGRTRSLDAYDLLEPIVRNRKIRSVRSAESQDGP